MKVILKKDVTNLGKEGEVKEVKEGYARNYLIPSGLAWEASESNLHRLEHEKKHREEKQKKDLKEKQKLVEKIETISCTIPVKTGESEKMFGVVTPKEIAENLKNEGMEIDKKQIELTEPIKELGLYTVPVYISEGLKAQLKIWVVKE